VNLAGWAGAYGALVATGVAAWNVHVYRQDRRARLVVAVEFGSHGGEIQIDVTVRSLTHRTVPLEVGGFVGDSGQLVETIWTGTYYGALIPRLPAFDFARVGIDPGHLRRMGIDPAGPLTAWVRTAAGEEFRSKPSTAPMVEAPG
jgi:hypothetical protein